MGVSLPRTAWMCNAAGLPAKLALRAIRKLSEPEVGLEEAWCGRMLSEPRFPGSQSQVLAASDWRLTMQVESFSILAIQRGDDKRLSIQTESDMREKARV